MPPNNTADGGEDETQTYTRRTYLTTTGILVGLAGCLSDNNGTGDGDTSTETGALSAGLTFEGAATGSFTEDGPATLELRLSNRLETEITATATLGPIIPFAGRFGQHATHDAQVLLNPDNVEDHWFRVDENTLVPTPEVLPTVPENGCWRVPPEYDGIAAPPGQVSREIAAKTSITHRYTLYHMHECVLGTYNIWDSITLAADGFETEEFVPLHLRVNRRDDGDIDIEFFGIQEGYSS